MMHVLDYIEHLRSKPEHIRHRIALGSSVGVTALVFAGWLVAFASSNALALAPVDTEAAQDIATVSKHTGDGFAELLGAAAAFKSAASGEANLTIVDGKDSSTIESPTEDTRTVIPF